MLVYDEKYIKAKVRECDGVIKTLDKGVIKGVIKYQTKV